MSAHCNGVGRELRFGILPQRLPFAQLLIVAQTMDVHRCRFVPFTPSAINALAFSHVAEPDIPEKGEDSLRLAVGRANGDVEIWNPQGGAWFQESVFRGGEDRSIEGLGWTQDPSGTDRNGVGLPGKLRLFSIGCSSEVTEWNLSTGTPARSVAGNMSEIWCIAIQPRLPNSDNVFQRSDESSDPSSSQQIAVGCADGSIVLFSTIDEDLQFHKVLPRPVNKKSRVLSIAYQRRHTVIAGYADSTIRVFDTQKNRIIRTLSLGAGLPEGPKETLVWSLTCLANGIFVSGDSTGAVKIWDGKNYDMRQSITSHTADVLTLSSSADGQTLFSGGMDRRTVVYKREGRVAKSGTIWKKVGHQRNHQHDVKAMASCDLQRLSVIASGGLDTSLIITPLRNFGKEYHRTLTNLPQKPPMCSAPVRRLMIAWWDRSICIWRILKPKDMHSAGLEDPEAYEDIRPRRLVAKIRLQGSESITHADISPDGRILTTSTSAGVKAFHLGSIKDARLKVRSMSLPNELASTGTKIVRFSPDQQWLATVTNANAVDLFKLGRGSDYRQPLVSPHKIALRMWSRNNSSINSRHNALGPYLSTICQITFSANSNLLLVGDLSGLLHSWILKRDNTWTRSINEVESSGEDSSTTKSSDVDEKEDTNGDHREGSLRWIRNPASARLPRLPNGPLALSFRPCSQHFQAGDIHGMHSPNGTSSDGWSELSNEDRLLVVTSAHELLEFNILSGTISDWSRRNPTSALPPDFKRIRDPAMGFLWDVNQGKQRVWMYGSTWLWMFDLAKELRNEAETHERGTKRKRSGQDKGSYSKQHHGSQKSGSGAGGRIRSYENASGLDGESIMRRSTDSTTRQSTNLKSPVGQASGDDDDDDDHEESKDQLKLRKLDRDIEPAQNGLHFGITNADDPIAGRRRRFKKPFWHTLKYRPILGLVTVGSDVNDDSTNGERPSSSSLEVALVERPLFEVGLPPRYHGNQEWDEQKT